MDLLGAGLHRLAQPLTAALWHVEVMGPAHEGQAELHAELHRAVSILHALRAVFEAAPLAHATMERLDAFVAGHQPAWAALCAGRGVIWQTGPIAESNVSVPSAVLAMACRESVQSLLQIAPAGSRMSAVVLETTLSLAVHLPPDTDFAEGLLTKLLFAVDPFHAPGNNFHDFIPSPLFRARIDLAFAGITMQAVRQARAVEIRFAFPAAPTTQ